MSTAPLAAAAKLESIIVDIADIQVSSDPQAEIVTYALGSCIAVCIYDPKRGVAGMIHYMLPHSKTSPEKAKARPGMFANVGVPMLFNKMYEQGCVKKDLVVKVVGGGTLRPDSSARRLSRSPRQP